MSRPRIYEEHRVATAIRLPISLHEQLQRLARTHDVSVNFLITRAVSNYLDQRTNSGHLETAHSNRPQPS